MSTFEPNPGVAKRGQGADAISSIPPDAEILGRSLSGKLPCVSCGYDLQGLSVLGVCPECGSAVRATILALVDPLADELKPIKTPKVVAAGLLLWSFGSLLACIIGWYAAVSAAAIGYRGLGSPIWPWHSIGLCIAGSMWLSGLGALGFVRPHQTVPRRNVVFALIAVAAYIPLGWVLHELIDKGFAGAMRGSVDPWNEGAERTVYRLIAGALGLIIIAGLRPNARILVHRSLVLRTGRVDRQTMLAMGAALSLIIVGDCIGLSGTMTSGSTRDALHITGITLMLAGSALLSLGLAGAMADCIRIARAVIAPGPSLRQVLAPRKGSLDEDFPTMGGGQ